MHVSNVDPGRFSSFRDRERMNVGEVERWISMIGGGTLMLYGLSRRSLSGLAIAAVGGGLVWRGSTGHCPVYQRFGFSTRKSSEDAVFLEQSVTILRPTEDVYQFFREVENLPRFVKSLESVRSIGGGRSHWVWKGPVNRRIEWDAQAVDDRPGELIRWRSLEGSDIEHQTEVRFVPAPGHRGTEVHLGWKFRVPMTLRGLIKGKVAELYTKEMLHRELERLKQVLEAGEVATTEGQSSGRLPILPEAQRAITRGRRVEVRRPAREVPAEAPTLH